MSSQDLPPPPPPPAYPPAGYPPAGIPPPGYPAPGYGYYQPPNDGMAITALVFGIASFPGICCYGIPAIALGATGLILGRMSLGKIRASGGTLGGEGLAQAGWISGLVGGSIGLLYALFILGTFLLTLFITFSSGGFGPTASPSP